MSNKYEMIKNMSAIYKYAFANEAIHKNTMKNQLLFKKKISSQNKFFQAFDRLVEQGGLLKDKELVSINPDIIKSGYLHKESADEFYVVVPETDKKYQISIENFIYLWFNNIQQ